MGREKELRKWLTEARERLWSAEFARKNDERQKGESEEHWKQRRKRNRERVERREEVVEHLKKKLEHLLKEKEEDDKPPTGGSGSVGYSVPSRSWNPYGKNIPNWMIPWLDKSREAGWGGVVVSGVRTSAYSVQLCYNMCGAPSCPGRCAGASSNHNMEAHEKYPEGALDVTDYYDFESIQFKIGSPLRNNLPIDPVHFSVSGY